MAPNRNQDNHVHELSLPPGGDWSPGDLSQRPGMDVAPAAAGDATGYPSWLDRMARVVYRGEDGHVDERSLAPGRGSSHGDLNYTGAPLAAGNPSGYLTG